jgi:hypothetical protein
MKGKGRSLEVKPEDIIGLLEYIRDLAARPTYNDLEAGFRHTPLSSKEIQERYADACREIVQNLDLIIPVVRDMHEDWANYQDLRNS